MPNAFFPDMTDAETLSAQSVMLKSLKVIPTAENRAKYREEAAEYLLALVRYLDNPTEQNLSDLAGEQADMLVTIWKSMHDIPQLPERTRRAFDAKIKRLYWLTARREEEQGGSMPTESL